LKGVKNENLKNRRKTIGAMSAPLAYKVCAQALFRWPSTTPLTEEAIARSLLQLPHSQFQNDTNSKTFSCTVAL